MVMERRPTANSLLALLRPAGHDGPDGPGRRFTRLLARYLAAAFVLLVLVYATGAAGGAGPTPRTTNDPSDQRWDHERDVVAIEGDGVLNAWARTAMQVTAWSTRGAVERQRDLHRFSLVQTVVGEPAAAGLGGWRQRNRLALEGGTMLAIAVLVGYGVLRSPRNRTWLLAALLLLAFTVVVTRPASALRLAGAPASAVGELTVRGFSAVDPATADEPRSAPPAQAEQALADGYWTSFVGDPLSRLQTGTPVLAAARPEAKPGLLAQLRDGITAVNDWAVGRRGWERAFIATTALAYALPFALAVGGLAMLAACAQALALVLGVGGLVALPLCVEPRWRPLVARYWLAPLGGCLVVLAAASLLALTVMRAADLVHSADEYLGLLLAGSALPVVLTVWLVRRLRRGRAGTGPIWRPRLALLGGGAR
jgi:hypothetical protein